MKTFEERTQQVRERIKVKKRKQKRLRGATALVCLAAMLVILFVPLDFSGLELWQYRNSPYYDLICKVHAATHEKPQSLVDGLVSIQNKNTMARPGEAVPQAPDANPPKEDLSNKGEYVETTDNQVAGVIEGDLIKRTDSHIFYLSRQSLAAYCIRGEASYQVGEFKLDHLFEKIREDGKAYWFDTYFRQMYLSEDGTAVTLILSGYGDLLSEKKENFLMLLNLDVSDPANMTEIDRVYLSGSLESSRLVDGTLMVFTDHFFSHNEVDLDQPETFVPRYGKPGDMTCIPAEDILSPEDPSRLAYTTVTLLNQKSLEIQDTAAFLSYSNSLYVSRDKIYAVHSYADQRGLQPGDHTVSMSEIGAMSYSGGKLELLGSTPVEGSVKDQYSMDEKDGILRVVTSTLETKDQWRGTRTRNANLYCIDLSDWTVIGKVVSFAPEGETVESVRFEGDYAYVCTAKVVELTDPVYFFDLSDPRNITWKDTGTIDGYSSSLVDFENGNLLGIGYGESGGMKIEMYRETESGVKGFAAYEQPSWLPATEYKAYFIDREQQMIGIPVYDREMRENSYLLLGFDGVRFRELGVFRMSLNADRNETRGLVIDGTVYLFDSGFYVYKLW